MMYISAQELRDYTVIQLVKNRDDELLEQDILEAQTEINIMTERDFSDTTQFPTVPDEVILATKKLAQYYAMMNSDESALKAVTSESIGNYQYSKGSLQKPDLSHLLHKYKTETSAGSTKVAFRLRKV